MKKIFTLAMMLLCVGSMMANWQPSDTEATRLDAEGTNGQLQMKTIRTDDGKIILSWLRGERINDVFSYQLHLQIFGESGTGVRFGMGHTVVNPPCAAAFVPLRIVSL